MFDDVCKVCERVRSMKTALHVAGPTLLFNKRLRVLYCAIGKVRTNTGVNR